MATDPILEADRDARLVDAVREGGPGAFRGIVERYQSAVFAVAMSRVRDFHRAEDVAQQVFLEAYQRLGTLKDPAKLGGWLRTITIRQSASALRRKRDEVAIREDGWDGLLVGDAVEDIERRELARTVRGAIGRLKKAHRDTTTLFYVDGYSIAEVAAILEVPQGTVKRRLHTAREILKTEMLDVVKDALTSEKPGDDFGERVFALIRQRATGDLKHQAFRSRIDPIVIQGFDGLVKALESPHGKTRTTAVHMISQAIHETEDDTIRDRLIDLLKACLGDPNKKVRRWALATLFRLKVPEARVRDEFAPLALDLLEDRAIKVANAAAWTLRRKCPEAVPIERAALALANATDRTRTPLAALVRAAAKAQH